MRTNGMADQGAISPARMRQLIRADISRHGKSLRLRLRITLNRRKKRGHATARIGLAYDTKQKRKSIKTLPVF